jgi:hypothetical protein
MLDWQVLDDPVAPLKVARVEPAALLAVLPSSPAELGGPSLAVVLAVPAPVRVPEAVPSAPQPQTPGHAAETMLSASQAR